MQHAEGRLQAQREKLRHMRSAHLCGYQLFEMRSSLAYVVRPYAYTTLHERLQVRPGCRVCLPAWCPSLVGDDGTIAGTADADVHACLWTPP